MQVHSSLLNVVLHLANSKSAHGPATTTPNQEFADLNPRVHFFVRASTSSGGRVASASRDGDQCL